MEANPHSVVHKSPKPGIAEEKAIVLRQAHQLRVDKVSSDERFAALRECWNNTLALSPNSSYFLRWEWLWTWWNVYKRPNYELCLFLVYKGDDLIGIAPFYVELHRFKNILDTRRLMFLGTKEGKVISEYMDIIYVPGEEEAILRKVMDFIVQEQLCDEIRLHEIQTSSPTVRLLPEIARRLRLYHNVGKAARSPYISLPGRYDDFVNRCRKSLRYKIRSGERRLMKYPAVVFRKTAKLSELDGDFNELVRLHQLRWEVRGLCGSFSDDEFCHFQKVVMRGMLSAGHLNLWLLSVSGRNIAAMYNITFGNRVYYYQSGLDVAFDKRISPGTLLHNRCISEAITGGIREYDFLLQGAVDTYKDYWTSDYRCVCHVYVALRDSRGLFMAFRSLGKS